MTRPTISLFGMNIHPLRMQEAVETIFDWVDQSDRSCHYVVTPNVDHAVQFQENKQLQDAYSEASLVLADGSPVVLAAKLLRRGVPERVAGSDLAPALFEATRSGRALRVYLLGAMPGVAERAARNITRRWPNVEVVGIYSPPLGFEKEAAENEKILAHIAEVQPDVLLVGLGAPKQELWVHQHHKQIAARCALCIGATIDFLAGEKRRAPVWMQKVGLEWLHRVATEPRRLIARYLRDAWIFPRLFWAEFCGWHTANSKHSV